MSLFCNQTISNNPLSLKINNLIDSNQDKLPIKNCKTMNVFLDLIQQCSISVTNIIIQGVKLYLFEKKSHFKLFCLGDIMFQSHFNHILIMF